MYEFQPISISFLLKEVFIRIINTTMGGVGHAACMGNKTSLYKVVVENLKETSHLKDLGVGGRTVNCSILRLQNDWWFIWVRVRTRGDASIKCGKISD
jgi:hypothetical protein